VFLLSPANASGVRAAMLVRPAAQFDLALELRSERGAALGAVFQFMSGLYFRGKLAYAREFARPPRGLDGALVIVPGRGLVPAGERVRPEDLAAFAAVPIDVRDLRYTGPLLAAAEDLARRLGPEGDAVLLGATPLPARVRRPRRHEPRRSHAAERPRGRRARVRAGRGRRPPRSATAAAAPAAAPRLTARLTARRCRDAGSLGGR
jgi:hypothetical protein